MKLNSKYRFRPATILFFYIIITITITNYAERI
jgi:hypothetical protein